MQPPLSRINHPLVRACRACKSGECQGPEAKAAGCNNFLIGAEIADGIDAMKGNFGQQAARALANLLQNASEWIRGWGAAVRRIAE